MKKATLTIISFLTFIFITVGTAAAQSDAARTLSESEKAVRKLERTWLDAYEQRNAESMSAIVADDFTITFPDGSIQTKPQIIASLKQAGGPSMKFTTENVQSRVYGDTVILMGIVVSEWKQGDKSMTDRSRYTDTYVRRGGRWQVVASHLSNAGK